MQTFKSNAAHHCQIDCTNHDEVINSLELKSKDLYYFWVFVSIFRETTSGYITSTTTNNQLRL